MMVSPAAEKNLPVAPHAAKNPINAKDKNASDDGSCREPDLDVRLGRSRRQIAKVHFQRSYRYV